MTVTRGIPSIEEMAKMVLKGRSVPSSWTPRELKSLQAARNALRAIPMSSSLGAVYEALRPCAPFACGLLDTIRASRPFDPVDVLYQVPETFIDTVAEIIEADPSPFVFMQLPLGTMCRSSDFIPESFWQSWSIAQALYPHHGIDFPSVLTLSWRPRAFDRELSTLWFFNEHDQRPLSDRELRMIEFLHGDIHAAIERLRLPFVPRDSLQDQILREQNAGYALVRANGELLECNRRAFWLARQYSMNRTQDDTRTPVSTLMRWAQAAPAPAGFSAKYVPSLDNTSVLEINLHHVAREHHVVTEDVTLVVLREIPLQLAPIVATKASVLDSLSPRQHQVATLLVNSGLSFKEIAIQMHISEGTLRKHAEHVYRALGVRSRAELGAMLK